jgi:hypothetical protein
MPRGQSHQLDQEQPVLRATGRRRALDFAGVLAEAQLTDGLFMTWLSTTLPYKYASINSMHQGEMPQHLLALPPRRDQQQNAPHPPTRGTRREQNARRLQCVLSPPLGRGSTTSDFSRLERERLLDPANRDMVDKAVTGRMHRVADGSMHSNDANEGLHT